MIIIYLLKKWVDNDTHTPNMNNKSSPDVNNGDDLMQMNATATVNTGNATNNTNNDGLDDILNLGIGYDEQEDKREEEGDNDIEFMNGQSHKVDGDVAMDGIDYGISSSDNKGDKIHKDKLEILDKYFEFFKLVINYN